jgi:hypothetical protein
MPIRFGQRSPAAGSRSWLRRSRMLSREQAWNEITALAPGYALPRGHPSDHPVTQLKVQGELR